MTDLASTTQSLFLELRGSDSENAYHCLIELGEGVIPFLLPAFLAESDVSVRSILVRVCWQTRSPAGFAFLARALTDSDAAVWKEALDGLVALGGSRSSELLREGKVGASEDKLKWINEAIQQIEGD